MSAARFPRFILGLALFAISYALLNQYLLVHSILYRAAANDYQSALISLVGFSLQAIVILIAAVMLPRRLYVLFLILVALSALINIAYGQILSDTVDAGKLHWMLMESRQAGHAAGEFQKGIAIAILKLVLAIIALHAARTALRQPISALQHDRKRQRRFWLTPLILCALIAPSLVLGYTGHPPQAAERNIYGYLLTSLLAPPPPDRRTVQMMVESRNAVPHIVWIIDESVAYRPFRDVVRPHLEKWKPLDFGRTRSIGNCSSPSNFALRAGVDVRHINGRSDLREMPTIWAYAKKAGYQTRLIDGQVSGPPQNLMLPGERKLIDAYDSAAGDIDTDRHIAAKLNNLLRNGKKQFIYVVLRGVHFQYRDHYPPGAISDNAPLIEQYRTALSYSKRGFFTRLLDGLDREKVAVIYTSDHGQNIAPGVTPHCSGDPSPLEFAVPLLAFVPNAVRPDLAPGVGGTHSASQIFPTTLALMGYSAEEAANRYDHLLNEDTVQYIWFGRSIIPVGNGAMIDLHRESSFPAR